MSETVKQKLISHLYVKTVCQTTPKSSSFSIDGHAYILNVIRIFFIGIIRTKILVYRARNLYFIELNTLTKQKWHYYMYIFYTCALIQIRTMFIWYALNYVTVCVHEHAWVFDFLIKFSTENNNNVNILVLY